MPPKQVIDYSAASLVDLKAQLAQQTEQFERVRSGAKHGPAANRRSDKKPAVWARQNKGVNSRAERDQVQRLEEVDSQSYARSREALERKAKIYEEMRTRARRDDESEDEEALIDFDRKFWEEYNKRSRKSTDSDDDRSKDSNNDDDDDDDPWVEYEDDFGRTRTVRRSQVPARSPSPSPSRSPSRSPSPPPMPREHVGYADRASIRHYDAKQENRTRGVGFYQFATDDEQRTEQMERLKQMREETEAARRNKQTVAERRKAAIQKNADKVRERRQAMMAKRRKKDSSESPSAAAAAAAAATTTTERGQQDQLNVNEDSISRFIKSVRDTMQ
ncbi:hypothetical protein BDB00DRAFT_881657 [Zychaea mexicana]|uniref:uncharacterized protein n=1 Tax=Zychaea mexicana TaxID=64656 RepID=UPI0022FDCABC|nr:uncharacterized protein BDB00DRAFT_881657 [Zychaea mexicana]KAI9497431.1 hypothetical protein BDB00DRAFT_881657 [Zychaea mexicana]